MENLEDSGATSKFNWIIWCFAVVGLLTALAIISIALPLQGSFNNRVPAQVKGEKSSITYIVDNVEPLTGTKYVTMDISSRSDSSSISSGSIKGSGLDQRNILLLDKLSGENRKILPDNNKKIVEASFFSAKEGRHVDSVDQAVRAAGGDNTDSQPMAYYLVEIEDFVIDSKISVLIGTLATGKQGVVMAGIDGIDSKWMLSPTEVGMLVREKQMLYLRVINIPELKVVKSVKLKIS